MAVEAGFAVGWRLMSELLAEGRAGILGPGSPWVSRSTEALGEWKASSSGLPWAEAGEEVVRDTLGAPGGVCY